jgi:hypothetical protein
LPGLLTLDAKGAAMNAPADPDYAAMFRDYAAAYERSLGDTVDSAAIRSFFAEEFIAAGANGEIHAGANDESFEKTLQQGHAFYKAIGTREMKVERVEVETIDPDHDQVRVFYRAGYEKKGGSRLTIPFDLVYLLQRRADGPKIFAFIAGDELALYRQHGLVNEKGEPA